MVSLLPRPSPHRKCALTGQHDDETDLLLHREMPGTNKAINVARNTAWPTQGGLPSIGTANSALFRGQIPAFPERDSGVHTIPPKTFSGVLIKPDSEMNIKSKTPSPQKQVTIEADSATGKENLNVAITPQSTH